jgi:hypothetical protein
MLGLGAGCDSGEASPGQGPHAKPRGHCYRYASPEGSNRARGSRRRPFRTLRRLVRSLRPGRTGCLLPGRYRHRGVVRMRRRRTALRGLGLPTVDGALWVLGHGARVAGLRLTSHDPDFTIPLKVQGDDVTVAGNEITASRSSVCVLVGSVREARYTVIEHNRIRGCGRTDKFHHLIYLLETYRTVVRWNVLTDNAGGWAVHMYPDADQTLVEHNVIDRNRGGVIFGGDEERVSNDSLVRRNAITFSGPRWNIEGSWGDAGQGTGNRAESNCLYSQGPAAPAGIAPLEGFAAEENIVLEGSPYRNRGRGDYRFRSGSPCAGLVGDVVGGLPRRLQPR